MLNDWWSIFFYGKMHFNLSLKGNYSLSDLIYWLEVLDIELKKKIAKVAKMVDTGTLKEW